MVTAVTFHQGTAPAPASNASSGVAAGGGKGHHGFYYPKSSSFQQQSEKHPGALIFMEVIISAGFSPKIFFQFFSLYFPFLFLSWVVFIWLVGLYF